MYWTNKLRKISVINKHQLIFTRPQPTKYIQNETEKTKEVFGNIGMGRVTITY